MKTGIVISVLLLGLIGRVSAADDFEVEQSYWASDHEITVVIRLDAEMLVGCAAINENEEVVAVTEKAVSPPKDIVSIEADELVEMATAVRCVNLTDHAREGHQETRQSYMDGDVPRRNSPEEVRQQRSRMNPLERQMDSELRPLAGMGMYTCEQIEQLITAISQNAPGAELRYSDYCAQPK